MLRYTYMAVDPLHWLYRKVLVQPSRLLARKFWTLYNKIQYRNGVKLICIIWPPASTYANEIVKDLESSYQISDFQAFKLDLDATLTFIREVYKLDRAPSYKIDPKLSRLMQPPHVFHIFEVQILKPGIVAHSTDNSWRRGNVIPIIKENIRTKFDPRIHNYIHDVIIHSVEYPEQNQLVIDLISAQVICTENRRQVS